MGRRRMGKLIRVVQGLLQRGEEKTGNNRREMRVVGFVEYNEVVFCWVVLKERDGTLGLRDYIAGFFSVAFVSYDMDRRLPLPSRS